MVFRLKIKRQIAYIGQLRVNFPHQGHTLLLITDHLHDLHVIVKGQTANL